MAAPADDHRADAALLDEVWSELGAVESALVRLESGSYWTCEICGGALDPQGLEFDPLTTRCTDHGSAVPNAGLGDAGRGPG
jgi:DnaK suppressor protein